MVKRSQLFCALAWILLVPPFVPGQANKKILLKTRAICPDSRIPCLGLRPPYCKRMPRPLTPLQPR